MDRLQRACCALRARRRHWPAAVGAGLIAAIWLFPPRRRAGGFGGSTRTQADAAAIRGRAEPDAARLRRPPVAPRIPAESGGEQTARRASSATRSAGPARRPTGRSRHRPRTAAGQARCTATFTIGTPPREPWPIGPATPPIANPSASAGAFNPAIGVVLQGKASAFSQNPDTYRVRGFALGDEAGPGKRGLSLDETELNFQASVDPYLFGNATLSISPDNHISVEEAFIQTTSLPAGFTLRAGRFFSGHRLSQRAAFAHLGLCRPGAALSRLPQQSV